MFINPHTNVNLVIKLSETTNVEKIEKNEILESFRPHKKLKTKYYVIFVIALILLNAFILLMLYAVSADEDTSHSFAEILKLSLPWIIGAELVFIIIPAIALIPLYFNSIRYELTTHEIIVYKGIITKSKKLVPYRNITNFDEKRGLLDRIIGGPTFGTIVIETAGMSGQSRPEQRLEGVMNIGTYTERIRSIVKKMKGTAAISADQDLEPVVSEEMLLKEILQTLKRIEEKL